MRLLLAALALLLITADVHAIGRGRLLRNRRSTYSYASYGYSSYASPQDAASAKAQIQANRGSCFHPGGGFGGGYAEGVGAGSTPAAALNNCCYTGQRPLLASAVFRGANGWYYACKIFR